MVEEQWTLRRYEAMCRHWKIAGPPVSVSVAGYLGLLKPDKAGGPKAKPKRMSRESAMALIKDFKAAGGVVH